MLNSFTNFLHASALGIYTYLVYDGLRQGEPHYTWTIFLAFLLIFVLKMLGIIVHLPYVENHKGRHDFWWTWIALGVCFLNYFSMKAINVNFWVIVVAMAITVACSAAFLYSMYTGPGYFFYIAGASVAVYLLAAIFTRDGLRIAWIMITLSSLAWILLEKVPFLYRNKFHNDIYHIALIISTYYLYATVATGLWENNQSLSVSF